MIRLCADTHVHLIVLSPMTQEDSDVGRAGFHLKTVRNATGKSQSDLSRLASTQNALISRIEAGQRDTKTATLDRLMAALGHQMIPVASTAQTAAELAIAVRTQIARRRPAEAWAAVMAFDRGLLTEVPATRAVLCHPVPASTTSLKWDQLIAAVCEYRMGEGAPHHPWMISPALDERWVFDVTGKTDGQDANVTPRAFLRRGIVFSPTELPVKA
jgi:transcriptional regulator with XRE-family HTH domain